MRQTILFAILAVLISGCAKSDSPVVPDAGNGFTGGASIETGSTSSQFLWGYYDVTIDPEENTIDFVPVRGTAFKANVTQFLQPPGSPLNLISFKNLNTTQYQSSGIITLTVDITHPFTGFPKYLGFDVRGVFIADATETYNEPDIVTATLDGSTGAILLNQDGLTRWFNPKEFTSPGIFGFTPGNFGTPGYSPSSTLNGYKVFADVLGATDSMDDAVIDTATWTQSRGSFSSGATNSRYYEIQFEPIPNPINFQYAVIASWEEPANNGVNGVDDFSLAANQVEAFHVSVDTSESTLYYEGPGVAGGNIHINMTVFDWQALDGDGGGESVPDSIASIQIDGDDSFFENGPVQGINQVILPFNETGSTYSFDLDPYEPTGTADIPILITINYPDPKTYDQGFGTASPDANLAAYFRTYISVSGDGGCATNQAPSVGAISGDENPFEVDVEDYTVAALDPEGDPLHYSWSLVADGNSPNWDNVGADSDTITIDWSVYGIGDFDLYCRVKDECNDYQYPIDPTNNPLDIAVQELSVTCGTGTFGYIDYAWTDDDADEVVFLSDGTTLIQYTLASLNWNWINVMRLNYETDYPGYCSDGPTGDNSCEDDWCRLWSHAYDIDNDGNNVIQHWDVDHNDTYGDGTETDDVVAFVGASQPSQIKFIGNINNTTQTPATLLYTKTIPTGEVIAMDFDDSGDLWVIDASGNTYELLKSNNYAVGSAEFILDMLTVQPSGVEVFDMAISYLSGDMFIFTDETVGGTIHRINTSGTVADSVYNALDAGISNPGYGLGSTGARGDIEIDHRVFTGENPLAEHCRLVISGGPGGTGQAAMFARYDQGLNLLSTWDNNVAGCSGVNPAGNDGGRFIAFDPIDHVDDPDNFGDEEAWDHTMWVGDSGTGAGNLVWASSCRPAPTDWDGW
jgi:hypothetical protein